MKNNIFKKLMTIVCLLFGLQSFATVTIDYDFKVGGICYNIISGDDYTVSVTYNDYRYDAYNNCYCNQDTKYSGSIVIPESVTYNDISYSVISIGSYAFYQCSDLTSVTIPNSVTSIGNYAFFQCRNLTSITIPEFVTHIGDEAFSRSGYTADDQYTERTITCNAKKPPMLGNNVFYDNRITLEVPFESIPAYQAVEGWAIKAPSSSDRGSMQYKSKEINGIYYISISETEVEVTYDNINSSKYSEFVNIPTTITVEGKQYNVTSIGSIAFFQCTDLVTVTLPNTVTNIGKNAFFGCETLVSVNIPNSVTSIGDYAFSNCSGLPSVIIGNSVTSIGKEAFKDCTGMTSVTIGNSVTSIGGHAFYNCRNLTSVTIPNSVTSIGDYAFYCCEGLTSVTIPNSVTSIGSSAFSGCSGLTSVTIPNSVTSIEKGTFGSCSSLTSVTIPNSVTSIGDSAFGSCRGLTSVTIPNSVTSIGDYAFQSCDGLTSVTIPNSVTSIGDYAFRSCTSLTSVTIPNSVEKIGNHTFSSCNSLKSVTLGNSLSYIGIYVFKNCSSITKVESKSLTAPTMTETVFESNVYENAQLVVPLGASESYQSATGWSKFTNTSAGYNVTVDYSSTGGVVSVNDSNETTVSVDFDTKVDFVITPNEGFEIEKVTLNEEDITENIVDGKYSLEKLTEDVIFAVTFRKLYTIATIFNSEEGVVTINGQEKNPIQVSFDTKVDFVITPNEGYEIDKVLLNEIDVTPDVVEGKYSIEKASEDVALNVTFRKLLIIGATFNNEEGRVTINGAEVNPILVSTGSTLDFVITPNEGYEIDKVLLNEVDVTEHLQEGLLHIENVAGNVVLNVTFRKMMLIVTEFASECGSVTINESEETSMFVSLGSKLDFTITPNEGYEIINVTLNDEDITADVVEGKYTIENATENVKLIVTFKLKTFALVLKCSEAGAFKRILNYGETATYEIVPSENWEINTVTLNGTDVTTELVDNVFTTPEITEDSELSVVFVDLATSVFSVYNTSDVKVYASQQTINIKGLEDNTPVAVYNPNGQMEYSKVATDYEMNINMNKNGVYLVKVGERTFKVIL